MSKQPFTDLVDILQRECSGLKKIGINIEDNELHIRYDPDDSLFPESLITKKTENGFEMRYSALGKYALETFFNKEYQNIVLKSDVLKAIQTEFNNKKHDGNENDQDYLPVTFIQGKTIDYEKVKSAYTSLVDIFMLKSKR